ncbi:Restnol dehydrogenase [Entamoeba marina]
MSFTSIVVIVLVVSIIMYLLRLYFKGGRNHLKRDLRNKVVVITGGTNGMGKGIAEEMVKQGARVISFSRNDSLAEHVINSIIKNYPNGHIEHIHMDLGDFKSIKSATDAFHEKYDHVDFLINNAGMLLSPYAKTRDGHEMIMGVNYIGHYFFNLRMMKAVERVQGRIIVTSSLMSKYTFSQPITFDCPKEKYNSFNRYGLSKLALAMMAAEMSQKFDITCVSIHPGVVTSNIVNNWPSWVNILYKLLGSVIFKSVEDGIQTALYCISSEKLENGKYYADCAIATQPKRLENLTERQELWEQTHSVVESYL